MRQSIEASRVRDLARRGLAGLTCRPRFLPVRPNREFKLSAKRAVAAADAALENRECSNSLDLALLGFSGEKFRRGR